MEASDTVYSGNFNAVLFLVPEIIIIEVRCGYTVTGHSGVYLCMKSLRTLAGCFPDKPSWYLIEHVFQGIYIIRLRIGYCAM